MKTLDTLQIPFPKNVEELAAFDATREVPYLKALCNRRHLQTSGKTPPQPKSPRPSNNASPSTSPKTPPPLKQSKPKTPKTPRHSNKPSFRFKKPRPFKQFHAKICPAPQIPLPNPI